jgi:hypothetical protein
VTIGETGPPAILSPVLAFFDRRVYRAAAGTWRGWAVLYSLAVTTLSWAVLMPVNLPGIAERFDEFVDNFESSFPEFVVQQGEFRSDAPQPFALTDSKGQAVLIIDESIHGEAAPDWGGGDIFFIGRDYIFYGDSTRMSRLAMGDVPDMDKAAAVRALRSIPGQIWSIGAAIFPLLVAGSLALRMILTFLWALLAAGVGKAFRRKFVFAGAFRVAAVASTPALIFSTVGDAMGLGGWVSWVGLAATVFYILFGMFALDKAGAQGSSYG